MAYRLRTAIRRHPIACGLLARLTLLLFALRAVLPAGYMPDLAALEHGQVRIVICTGAGPQALLVDEAGQPVERQDAGDAADGDWAFATAVSTALALPEPASVAVPAGRMPAARPRPQWQTADLTDNGPPLGPRAPPLLLG